jgi:L-threonylcarbamoyladenylate synthase
MNDIQRAVQLLRQGELVALPTETVYGLGADALNPDAVAKIFAAKGRPSDHPLIVHLADASQIMTWAREVPKDAIALARAFWPGPLTLILKKDGVPDLVTGGQDTVGLRVPNHPVALELLRAFGSGVAAPSANRFGRISPTTAEHVRQELGERVALILDGGACGGARIHHRRPLPRRARHPAARRHRRRRHRPRPRPPPAPAR